MNTTNSFDGNPKVGFISTNIVALILFVPTYLTLGYMFNLYWGWFAQPISTQYFNHTLPTLSVGVCAIVTFVLYRALSPVINSSSRASVDEYTVNELIYHSISPFVFVVYGIFYGYVAKLVFM